MCLNFSEKLQSIKWLFGSRQSILAPVSRCALRKCKSLNIIQCHVLFIPYSRNSLTLRNYIHLLKGWFLYLLCNVPWNLWNIHPPSSRKTLPVTFEFQEITCSPLLCHLRGNFIYSLCILPHTSPSPWNIILPIPIIPEFLYYACVHVLTSRRNIRIRNLIR